MTKGGERELHKQKTVITLVLDDNLHENSVYTTKVTSFVRQSLLLEASFANVSTLAYLRHVPGRN